METHNRLAAEDKDSKESKELELLMAAFRRADISKMESVENGGYMITDLAGNKRQVKQVRMFRSHPGNDIVIIVED